MEELQLILESMKELGAEGKSAFLWYLVYKLVDPILITGIVLTITFVGRKLISKAMINADLTEKIIVILKNKGHYDVRDYGCIDENEVLRVIKDYVKEK